MQIWEWLEDSGLEINAACMNAYLGCLMRQVRPSQMLCAFPITASPATPSSLHLHSAGPCLMILV